MLPQNGWKGSMYSSTTNHNACGVMYRGSGPVEQKLRMTLISCRAVTNKPGAQTSLSDSSVLMACRIPSTNELLRIRRVEPADARRAAKVMSDAFTTATHKGDQISVGGSLRLSLRELAKSWPKSAFVIGETRPDTDDGDVNEESESVEWDAAGIASITFDRSACEDVADDQSLPLPDENDLDETVMHAYISNMSVAPEAQRKGIATRLLCVLELLAPAAMTAGVRWTDNDAESDDKRTVLQSWLHARKAEEPAVSLYRRCGFSVVDSDSPILAGLLQPTRVLMAKKVELSSLQADQIMRAGNRNGGESPNTGVNIAALKKLAETTQDPDFISIPRKYSPIFKQTRIDE